MPKNEIPCIVNEVNIKYRCNVLFFLKGERKILQKNKTLT